MADEIKIYTDSGLVMYVLIRRALDMFIFDVGDTAFEIQGVWDDTRLGECDLVITEGLQANRWYMTDFPATIAAGLYYLQFFRRLGSSPSVANDIFYGGYDFGWSGKEEVELLTKFSAGTILRGTVDTASFTPTTSQFECDDITEATQDHYKDRTIIFTSGALKDQAKSIFGYQLQGGKGRFTVAPALTEAPANNDTFVII